MNNSSFRWSRLDNAAKIFPSTTGKYDTRVFRFSCELAEPVDCACLSAALDEVMGFFPFFRCTLRRGMFWYFLEESDLKPSVHEENEPPCSQIYHRDHKELLFSVTYYRNRINLEIYHALCDGTGALIFLRMLVMQYLLEKHSELKNEKISMNYDASLFEMMDDSFQKYYTGRQKHARKKMPGAYHISGRRISEARMSVVEGSASVKQVIEQAHKYGVTMSVFLCGVLVDAIHAQMTARQEKNPVVLAVPVNLRNYFSSESARNFFSVINVGYNFSKSPGTLEDIMASLKDSFERELAHDRISARVNEYCALEHNAFTRLVPLALKDIGLRIGNYFNERGVTAALSNVGKITMPDKLSPYIRSFSVFTNTSRPQMCMCSYKDSLVMSFTSPLLSREVERRFFRTLSEMGVELTVSANRTE